MKRIILVILSFLVLFSSCSNSSSSFRGKGLVIPIKAQVHSLDPRHVTDHNVTQLVNMVFEGLMRYDENGKLTHGLAERFDVNENCTEYTFSLRPSQWSDGVPVTAYDFAYAWKSALSKKHVSTHTHLLFFIKNAQAYYDGAADESSVGIQVLDDRTLHIVLKEPTPFFLEMLTIPIYKPVPLHIDSTNPNWAREIDRSYVGNGPFSLVSFERRGDIFLEKNPNYWEADHVKLESIVLSYIPDEMAQVHMFNQGKLDWIGHPFAGYDYEVFMNLFDRAIVQNKDILAINWLLVNVEDPILKNKNIRKAIAKAIQPEEITEHVLYRRMKPAHRFLPRGFHVPNRVEPSHSDAKDLLEEGLQELGLSIEKVGPIRISMGGGINRRVCELIQAQVRDKLGLRLVLEQQEWKVELDNVKKGNFQMAKMSWYSSYADPVYFFDLFGSNKTGVHSQWKNSMYASVLASLKKEYDYEKRIAAFHKLENIILEDLPVIPLYFTTYPYVVSPRVKGVLITEMGVADLRYVEIQE